jgi:hypothetical protein
VTIFYCLRFETSLFVASYDSQGYGGGIRSCLHTGYFWEELIACVPLYDTDSIENDASNSSSIVACVFVSAVKFLPSRCLTAIEGIYTRTDGRDL